MNPKILKNIFHEFAPSLGGMGGLTAAGGGGLYGLAKWYDASNEKNLQSPEPPESQPKSGIIKLIADTNPNSKKLYEFTNPKWPLESMFTYRDPKSTTYEDPVSKEDFAYNRSVAANNIQAELQAAKEQDARDQDAWNRVAMEQNERIRDAMEQAALNQQAGSNISTGGSPTNNDKEAIDPNEIRLRESGIPSVTQAQPNTSNSDPTPAAPDDGKLPQGSQHPGATTYAPNQTVAAKTDDKQSNSIAASLNNNPGYLMPTAIGQTLIAALLGRLLGGNTGMGLGAIMGLLASPLTASYLARNNYLSDIAKPFAETEKGWFNPNKSE